MSEDLFPDDYPDKVFPHGTPTRNRLDEMLVRTRIGERSLGRTRWDVPDNEGNPNGGDGSRINSPRATILPRWARRGLHLLRQSNKRPYYI